MHSVEKKHLIIAIAIGSLVTACGGGSSPAATAAAWCDRVASECGFLDSRARCERDVERSIEDAFDARTACGAAFEEVFSCEASRARCADFDENLNAFNTCESQYDSLFDEC